MAKLDNWSICSYDGNTFLRGIVSGHPYMNIKEGTLVDGHEIMTSKVVDLDIDNGIAITKSGTVYELCNKRNM